MQNINELSTRELSKRRAHLSETRQAMLDKLLKGQATADAFGDGDSIQPREESQTGLSCAQQRLFFLDHLQSVSVAYNMSAAFELNGVLCMEALQQALDETVRRHEILRTVFVQEGKQLWQKIMPVSTVACPLTVLDDLSEDRRRAEQQRLHREELQRPFDLAKGPLLRVNLIRLAENRYRLLFTLHHIVSDGWSIGILVREFAALYRAFSAGLPSPLAELPIQYADFACWQKHWLQGPDCRKQLAYWRQQLQGAPETLSLPTDKPRPAQAGHRGANYHFSVADSLAAPLVDLSRRHGVSLFVTLLAAFNVLLYRYSSQQAVCVGTPVANRNRRELEDLIGFFVNTLVLRSDLSGNPAFTTLLEQCGKTVLDAQAHQDLPFDKLVEALGGARDLNRTPLFQVMFVMQNTPSESFSLPGLQVRQESADTGTAKFDLTLLLSQSDDGLQAIIEYNTDLYEPETITRMAGHYLNLLQGIVSKPDRGIAELSLLGKAEQRQILHEWNATEANYPQDRWLHELIEQQAESTPDAVAVIYEQRLLSYAELNIRANQLAHHLRGCGIGSDVLVGVCMERSLEMVIALLGVLKAGGAYVPLDPGYPQERLAFMMNDVNAPVILTQSHFQDKLATSQAKVLCLDSQWPELAGEPVHNPSVTLKPEHLVYCIYTSGSTGQPKGAVVPHRGILNRLQWMQEAYRLDQRDRVLQKTPFSFDVSVWEFFWPLMTGATLVMAPPEQHKDSLALIELINRHQVTTLHFVPSMLQAFLDTPGVASCASLKRVICSGEALPAELVRRFYRHSGATLHNLYGPTEASVDVSYWACPVDPGTAVPIGKPIANTALYILDKQLNPVPVGIAGELHIGGVGLARGYLNRPDLSAEKFIPNPFAIDGSRLYKTGDLSRFRPDGDIEYLGRIDHQVKIRGFRIELGEIEVCLNEHPDIKEAAVLAREDLPGDKRLVAYLVANGADAIDTEGLRAYLGDKLPDYMVPGAFAFLDAMPLSSNGKLDRKVLPAPDRQAQRQTVYLAPRNQTEAILAAIWADVLGLETVGIEDNFLALGGDSIRSLQVINLAKEQGIDISLEQLYRHGNVHALAAQQEASPTSSAQYSLLAPFALITEHDRALLPQTVEDAYPLTTLQAGMIFHSEYDRAAYHLVDSIELRCEFDSPALQTAIRCTVARHPVLRTAFAMGAYSEPLQLVFNADALALDINVDDWRGLPEGRQQAQFSAWLELEKSRPFVISQAPLIRFYIHQFSDERFRFTVTEHHAILDGWSLVSMLNEMFSDYRSLLKGDVRQALPASTNALPQLLLWEREASQSEAHRRYWREKLADARYFTLPSGVGIEEQVEVKKDAKQLTTLSHELTQGLQSVAKALGVPLKTVLLAAHLKVLSMLYGERDITTGLVCSIRPETADADRALGVFLNTLPFPMQLQGGSWQALILKVFAAEQELLKFRFYPLAQIQQDRDRAALFDAMFYYLHYHIAGDLLQSDELNILGWDDHIQAIFTLAVAFHLDIQSARLQIVVAVDESKLSAAQVGHISGYFVNVLTDIAASPAHRHDRRCFLSADEQRLLTAEWNPANVDYPQGPCIDQCFEQQVDKAPDAVALVFEGQSLSYAELNAKANQVAHYLIARGVGPDRPVAVCTDRSLDMMVALLGVLKAGGAYVPLDPGYPEERLAYQMLDASVALLITQAHLLPLLPDVPVSCICIDSDWPEIARQPDVNPNLMTYPLQLAYIIYTSGSTGHPKGVMVSHHEVLRLFSATREQYRIDSRDVWTLFHSYAFDFSVWEMWGALLYGGRLVIVPYWLSRSPEEFYRLLQKERVTVLNQTPSAFLQLMRVEEQQSQPIDSSLRLVIFGGEALEPLSLKPWFDRHGDRRPQLVNMYGITETTVHVTFRPLTRQDLTGSALSPIGRPLADLQTYLLDADSHPVPVNSRGELHVGGAGLARGYLNRPDLTAERFIPNPFGKPGSRLYKSGDVACYRQDGELEYAGRVDHQVKIRGFRIELGEIENRLLQHPDVKEAVLLVREDTPGDKRLTAYIIGESERQPTVEDLNGFLKARLPDYMLPNAYVFPAAMPLTANGKLDRKALPAPDVGEQLKKQYVAPRTDTESILVDLWAAVLGLERVGIDDHFFDLGGHSLIATQLMSRLSRAFNIELPLKMLFEAGTVEQLAEKIDLALWAQTQASAPLHRDETDYEDIAL